MWTWQNATILISVCVLCRRAARSLTAPGECEMLPPVQGANMYPRQISTAIEVSADLVYDCPASGGSSLNAISLRLLETSR